jgi:hypothetical protein
MLMLAFRSTMLRAFSVVVGNDQNIEKGVSFTNFNPEETGMGG